MTNYSALKMALYEACVAFADKREAAILSTIKSHQLSLQAETKSSAGDKHETGRAMLQLEMEKSSKQLISVYQMKQILSKIDHSQKEKKTGLGSLVLTNSGKYYLAISAGELKIDNESYYAVSIDSPIGKLLLGSVPGECLFFRKQIEVIDVV